MIRLTPAQYRAACSDIDGRTFVVTADVVNLPATDGDTVAWKDWHHGDIVSGVPKIFAVAAINENEIEETQ